MRLFAAFILLCSVLTCFFAPRRPGMEEAGVFNAAYTFAHFGKMAFPVYGADYADSFGIHPHLHYGILGLLLRMGLPLYVAEGLVISAASAVLIALIAFSRLPDTIKLGFLAGAYSAIVLAVMFLPDHAVGVRPELHVSLAWFAALVALEDARLRQWDLPRLCLGVFLICYAAAMQNYALLAPLGLLVYAVLLFRAAPWREAAQKTAICAAVACLVGVPFLLWYVFPNWDMITINIRSGTAESDPLSSKLATYFATYRDGPFPAYRGALHSAFLGAAPIVAGLRLHIPIAGAALALLVIWPSTRFMAVASLPVTLLVMATLPKAHYFISEQVLFLAAFWATVLTAAGLGLRALTSRVAWVAVLAAGCAVAVLLQSPPLGAIPSFLRLPLDEMDVARAVAKQIVGPGARVASRHLGWYITGGEEWYRVERDLIEPETLERFDAAAYAAQFDAIADYSMFSWQTASGVTPTSIYQSGAVQLKGFFLPQRMASLGFVLFQAPRRGGVTGYVLRDDRLQRFDQDEAGSVVLLLARGPRDKPEDPFPSLVFSPNLLDVPGRPPTEAISAYLLDRAIYQAAKATGMPARFQILDNIAGRLTAVDAYAMVKALRASDRPIDFVLHPQETAIRTFLAAAGHPVATADACRLTDVRLARPQALISSGFFQQGYEASNLLSGNGQTWGSEETRTRLQSYIGADFGEGHAVALRSIALQHALDPASRIGSALLMSSANGYDWKPQAEMLLDTSGNRHSYCFVPHNAYRYWKLLALDNAQARVWQIAELSFYE